MKRVMVDEFGDSYTVEFRVTYQRAGWKQPQSRIFQFRHAADRLVARLRSDTDYEHLASLVRLEVSYRLVPWNWTLDFAQVFDGVDE